MCDKTPKASNEGKVRSDATLIPEAACSKMWGAKYGKKLKYAEETNKNEADLTTRRPLNVRGRVNIRTTTQNSTEAEQIHDCVDVETREIRTVTYACPPWALSYLAALNSSDIADTLAREKVREKG